MIKYESSESRSYGAPEGIPVNSTTGFTMSFHCAHRASQFLPVVFDQLVADQIHGARHDLIQFINRQTDPMITDSVFWKVISSNSLTTIARTDQRLSLGVAFFDFFLLKVIVQTRFQNSHRLGQVLVLRSLFETLDHDASRVVRDSNGRRSLVHVLAAGTATGGVAFDVIIFGFQFDFDVFGLGQNSNRRGRRVDSSFGLRFGNALNAMTATFILQFAVTAFAFDRSRDFFETA